jgi:hypothetical protein
MEIISKKSGKYRRVRLFLSCLFLFFYLSGNQIIAQATTDSVTTTDSAATAAASDDGFAKHGGTHKILDEAKRIQDENIAAQRRSDIITWICMIAGFSLVIAIAWFTTSLAKKRRIIEDEKRAKRAAAMQHNPHRKPHRR